MSMEAWLIDWALGALCDVNEVEDNGWISWLCGRLQTFPCSIGNLATRTVPNAKLPEIMDDMVLA